MAILVGIDEAGFGPILGPLVVSSSTFRISENLVWADMWEILHESVSDKRAGLHGRLLIADSKKAYSRSLGIGQLRRTVLAILKRLEKEPKNLTDLIMALCPGCLDGLRLCPWYKRVDEYLLQGNDADVAIAASMLKKDLAANNIELLDLQSRCLEVGHYNQMIAAVNNKANVLFTAVAELISGAVSQYKNENLEIVADRQGGRSRYQRQLQLMFPDMELKVIREDQRISSYRLSSSDRHVRVHFVVGADDRYLPVSLASMTCKYIREVLIDNINNYFTGFNKALKPTAGYWKDGQRFIADIKTLAPAATYDANLLVRCR